MLCWTQGGSGKRPSDRVHSMLVLVKRRRYAPGSTLMWQIVLFMLPWFHYGKFFTDVMKVTGVMEPPDSPDSISQGGGGVVQAQLNDTLAEANSTYYSWARYSGRIGKNGLPWDPFPAPIDGDTGEKIGGGWWAPSAEAAVLHMFALTIVYHILAWYMGQVVDSQQPIWFLIMPEYWGCAKPKILPRLLMRML